MDVELLETRDGTHTLFVPELNETFHSRKSAIKESQWVYIDHGLALSVERWGKGPIHVLEVGFGTGLNVWLSAFFASHHPELQISLTTLEPFPLPQPVWSKLNYPIHLPEFEKGSTLFRQMHTAEWEKQVPLTPQLSMQKIQTTLESIAFEPECFDLVYFDAFAPSKQPDIWSVNNFRKLHQAMKKEGLLTTYCASALMKKNLKSADFEVGVLKGPLGKREMVHATKG
jgi:tRNA U34 5-methylaminomethyl-2-thiouridine-forming methyltransferase MnmC